MRDGHASCGSHCVLGESVPAASKSTSEEKAMGKYFLAWLLGVPAFVLVIVYLFFN